MKAFLVRTYNRIFNKKNVFKLTIEMPYNYIVTDMTNIQYRSLGKGYYKHIEK